MPLVTLEALYELREGKKPLMGIDMGDKTLGLALSDKRWQIASPYETILRVKFKADARALKEIIMQADVGGIVVGLPLNMNATEGPRVQKTRQFVQNLSTQVTLPIAFWDERLSTIGASHVLREVGLSNAKQKKVVDKLAASFILQGALDYFQHKRDSPNPVD
jgi:putative Holliday junction resolvase